VWYKELTELNANYKVISGTGPERYAHAVKAIDEFLISDFGCSISELK